MATNPLAAKLAGQMHINVSWAQWAIAAVVPGVVSLVVVPLLIYRFYHPEVKKTPRASELAKQKLAAMGKMRAKEWIMLAVFMLLLFLWIFGDQLGGIGSATTALVGLGVLLINGVLIWQDILDEEGAWDTLVWSAALVMMASFLVFFGSGFVGLARGGSWPRSPA
jgi:divalent anion:Na+ symporter, DASS family